MLPQAHRFSGNLVVSGNCRLRPKMFNKFLKCVHVEMIHFFYGECKYKLRSKFFWVRLQSLAEHRDRQIRRVRGVSEQGY